MMRFEVDILAILVCLNAVEAGLVRVWGDLVQS
jgi:hypothetical protein